MPAKRSKRKKRVRVIRKRNKAFSQTSGGKLVALFGAFLVGYVAFVGAGLAWKEILSAIDRRGYFELKQIVVSGTNRTSRKEILQACGLYGFEKRKINIMRINIAAVAEAVSALPWVHIASVERSGVHELKITVEEEQPVARIHFSEEIGVWLVNGEGKAFVKSKSGFEHLPTIFGISDDELSAALVAESVAVKQALAVLSEWKRVATKNTKLVELHAHNLGYDAVIEHNGKRAVAVLGLSDYEHKFVRLLKLWSILDERGEVPEWFFVNNSKHPNWITVRFRSLDFDR